MKIIRQIKNRTKRIQFCVNSSQVLGHKLFKFINNQNLDIFKNEPFLIKALFISQ